MGELIDNDEASLQTGPFGTQFKASEYVESGIPMINVKNIGYGDVRTESLDYLDEKTAHRLRAHHLKTGDIVFGRKGSADRHTLIRPANDGWVQGSDCMRLRLTSKRLQPRFLSYYFCTFGHKYWMEAVCAFGATMSTLNQGIVRRIALRVPEVEVQDKIAAVLSAYDDLIENNRRRIALLEKLAEGIYREWFVRLRFPDHEKVRIVKGVPQGWKLVKLDNAFKFTGGGTPSKEVGRYWNGGDINWFTPSDITGADGMFLEKSGDQCTEEGFNNSSAKMFPAYSVMLTSRATIGAIGINTTPACTNQGFITCIPNAQYPLPYLYQWTKLAKPHFELLAGGTTFAELTKGTFKRIEILTPPEPIVAEFSRIESPLFKNIETLLSANRKLIETRDKLLPRLISGKLPVENLDIQFPPGMAEELNAVPTAHS
jgi:type I restriction enzyme S subunit